MHDKEFMPMNNRFLARRQETAIPDRRVDSDTETMRRAGNFYFAFAHKILADSRRRGQRNSGTSQEFIAVLSARVSVAKTPRSVHRHASSRASPDA
jgi:hypothetical protein